MRTAVPFAANKGRFDANSTLFSINFTLIQPKSIVRGMQFSFECWAYCLPYSWRRSGLRRENKTGKLPASKRKMNS